MVLHSAEMLFMFLCISTCVATSTPSATAAVVDLLRGSNDTKSPKNGQNRNPFKPNVIDPPFQDIDCDAQACVHNSDCADYPERLCRRYAACNGKGSGRVCLHKDLMPAYGEDLAVYGAMFVIGVAAGATGIGGGGLNVPMLMLWSRFDIKEAVPLSHSAVMGNALAMLLINAPQRHPACPQRPLIHYELALLLLPAMLGGSSLGVIVGRAFPPALLIVLSLFLLVFATGKTVKKGMHIAHARRATAPNLPEAIDTPQLNFAFNKATGPTEQVTESIDGGSLVHSGSHSGTSLPPWPRLAQLQAPDTATPAQLDLSELPQRTWSGDVVLKSSKVRLPFGNQPSRVLMHLSTPVCRVIGDHVLDDTVRIPCVVIAIMIFCNVAFTVDIIAMKEDVTGVETCSPMYWAILLGLYPLVAIGIWGGAWSLRKLSHWHAERGDGVIEGDPVVSPRHLFLYPFAAGMIGLVAGLLGLGGGEFMVPLLLEIGVQTTVASATSGFLMLFTTMSNIIHYFVAGTLQKFLGYAVTAFCVAFSGGMIGLILRDRPYTRKNTHLVVYLLACLLTIGGVLLAYRGRDTLDTGSAWGFKAFCPS